jgi:hypothetical protein
VDSLSTTADRNKFLNTLKPQNTIFTNLQTDILSFGFRAKDMYFSFNFSVKGDVNLSYPKDFARIALFGIDSASTYNFKQLGINSTLYTELALGVSKPWNEYLTFGGKIKFISGIWNVNTDNQKLALTTSVDNNHNYLININSNATINAYLPYFDVPKPDASGNIILDSLTKIKAKKKPFANYSPFNSLGLGFDLGATYSGIDQVVLSASLIDLGFISWRNYSYNFKMNGNYTFSGVGNIDLLHGGDTSLNNIGTKIMDSIKTAFKFKQQNSNYTTSLPTKLFLAGEYFPEKFFSLGLLSITQYYNSQFYEQITVSGNFRPLKMLMLSVSYSILNNGFSNFGLGISHRMGPLNIYFVSDNIPFKFGSMNAPVPYEMMGFNFRFGMNLVFGIDKKYEDKPYLWE